VLQSTSGPVRAGEKTRSAKEPSPRLVVFAGSSWFRRELEGGERDLAASRAALTALAAAANLGVGGEKVKRRRCHSGPLMCITWRSMGDLMEKEVGTSMEPL
jgi:hypothetical protein